MIMSSNLVVSHLPLLLVMVQTRSEQFQVNKISNVHFACFVSLSLWSHLSLYVFVPWAITRCIILSSCSCFNNHYIHNFFQQAIPWFFPYIGSVMGYSM